MFTRTAIFVIALLLSASTASAQIPQTLSYQGVLTNSSGTPLPNANYQLTFRIYDMASGGTALWTEIHPTVQTDNGFFTVSLGSITTLNLAFDKQYHLSIQVDSDPEMSPRIALDASAYSLNAKSVEDNAITSSKIASGTVIRTVNSITDSVNLVAGANITISPVGNDITISSSASGSGGNTLDGAYDEGGAGAGRSIIADNGAVEINGTDGLVIIGGGKLGVGIATPNPSTFIHSQGNSIGTRAHLFENTDNTNAASHVYLQVQSGGTNAGDALSLWSVNGTGTWYAGLDNDDDDKFKISRSQWGSEFIMDTSGSIGLGGSTMTRHLNIIGTNTGGEGIAFNNTGTSGESFSVFSTGTAAAVGAGKFATYSDNTGDYVNYISGVGAHVLKRSNITAVGGSDVALTLWNANGAQNQKAGIAFTVGGTNADRNRAGIFMEQTHATQQGSQGDLVFYTRYAPDGTQLQTTDERMRITSTGQVGIGITPTQRFEVSGGHSLFTGPDNTYLYTKAGDALATSWSGLFNLSNGSTGVGGFQAQNDGNTVRMFKGSSAAAATQNLDINSSGHLTYSGGNAGIGDTDPTEAKLVVRTSGTAEPGLFLTNSSGGSPTGNVLEIQTGSNASSFDFVNVQTDKFVVRGDGNVGIGTNSPNGSLHVESATPQIWMDESDAPADQKHWAVQASSSFLEYKTVNDASSSSDNYMAVTRSAETVTGVNFYTNNDTQRLHLDLNGGVFINDASNANMTMGLTISQGANDNESLALKSSDVNHGTTGEAETDTYFTLQKRHADYGGTYIRTLAEDDASATGSFLVDAMGATASTDKSTTASGLVNFVVSEISGGSLTGVTTDGNVFSVQSRTVGSGVLTRFLIDADGDRYISGTEKTFSDRRIKADIKTIPYGLREVLRLRPTIFGRYQKYDIKNGAVTTSGKLISQLGFIAQEVQKTMPLLVEGTESKELLTINEQWFIPVLVKAVQEQQNLINEKDNAIENQQVKLESQQAQLTQQQTKLDTQQALLTKQQETIDILFKRMAALENHVAQAAAVKTASAH